MHIVAVPVFVLGVLGIVASAMAGELLFSAVFVPLPVISLAVQGVGHKRESVSPDPFTGPANFIGRIFAEQFVKSPLFVASVAWERAMRSNED